MSISEKTVREWVGLYRAGISAYEIARLTGASWATVVKYLAKEYKPSEKRGPARGEPARASWQKKAIRLREKGKTMEEIALACGVSKQRVHQVLKGHSQSGRKR